MSVDERIRTGLRDQARLVDVKLPPAEDVIGRARRVTVAHRAAAVTAGVALVVGFTLAAEWVTRPSVEVVDQPSSLSSVDVTLLDATQLRLILPETLANGLSRPELAGSLYAAGSLDDVTSATSGWRIEAAPGALHDVVPGGVPVELPAASSADAAVVDEPGRQLGMQFGSWVVVASGEALTDDHIGLLLDSVDVAESADGFLTYQGSLTLWVVDSPDLRLRSGDSSVSIFLRACSSRSDHTTEAGLTVSRTEDPQRGTHLTVLCDIDQQLEIWLETPERPADTSLEQVDVDTVSTGATLSAVQAGRGPGSVD